MEKTLRGIVQYTRKNYLSYWLILGIDTGISMLCSLLGYAIIHYMVYVPIGDWMFCQFIAVSTFASIAGFLLFHTYRDTICFSQVRELWCIICAVLFKIACLCLFSFCLVSGLDLKFDYKLSFLIFDGLLTLVCLPISLLSLIVIYDLLLNWVNKKNTRILIYGIDEKSVAPQLRLRDSPHYKVVGFMSMIRTISTAFG